MNLANIFPSDYNKNIQKDNILSQTIETLKEYAIDFETGEVLIDDNGKFIIVEGLEALKVRNYLDLNIYRDRWFIYGGKVGNRLKDLIGKDLSYMNRNIQIMLEEALLDHIYVTSIKDITTMQLENSKLQIEFTVNSIYGPYTRVETLKGDDKFDIL